MNHVSVAPLVLRSAASAVLSAWLFLSFTSFPASAASSAKDDLVAALDRLDEEYTEDLWAGLGRLLLRLSYDEALGLDGASDHVSLQQQGDVVLVMIHNQNPTQNFVATRESDGSTAWLTVPGFALRVTDAAVVGVGAGYLVLVGYDNVEGGMGDLEPAYFASVYRHEGRGWVPHPKAFERLQPKLGPFTLEVHAGAPGKSAPTLQASLGDPADEEAEIQWGTIRLLAGPVLEITAGEQMQRLTWSGAGFVVAESKVGVAGQR